MHIPKTAGTSVYLALATTLGGCFRYAGFDRSQFGGNSDLDKLGPHVQNLLWPSWEKASLKHNLLVGHLSYNTLTQAAGNRCLMTVLREPISRLLSLWLFWRQVDTGHLDLWGTWGDTIRMSHQPLERFLLSPQAACQTDNIVVRMLLSPDSRIPAASFIDPVHDEALVMEAAARLLIFDFLAVTETPDLQLRLQAWLGRGIEIGRQNEMICIPEPLRSPMDQELTVEAHRRLSFLSRLDLKLWQKVVQTTLPEIDAMAFQEKTVRSNIARYSAIMSR